MNKRAENKAQVKQSLLNEALRLFSSQGYEDTTVADIVQACGIGRGTFYNYYPDAKSIFEAVVEKINTEIQIQIKRARKDAENFYELLYASFKNYFDYVSTPPLNEFHRKNQAYIRNTAYSSEAFRKMTLDVKDQMVEHGDIGHFTKKHEYLLLSILIMGGPIELFLNQPYMDANLSNEDMAKFLAKLFIKILSK